jgi:hypothetical protein
MTSAFLIEHTICRAFEREIGIIFDGFKKDFEKVLTDPF